MLLLIETQRFDRSNGGVAETSLNGNVVFPLQLESSGRDGHIIYSVLKALILADTLQKSAYDSNDDGSVDKADTLDYNGLTFLKKDADKVSILNEITEAYGIEIRDGAVYLSSDSAGAVGPAEPFCYVNGSAIMTLATMITYLKNDGSVDMEGAYTPTEDQGIATKIYVDDTAGVVQTNLDTLSGKVSTRAEIHTVNVDVLSVAVFGKMFSMIPSGETWKLNRVSYLCSGTCTINIQQEGIDLAGFDNISVTSTKATTNPTAVALTDNTLLGVYISAQAGSNLTVTLEIEKTYT